MLSRERTWKTASIPDHPGTRTSSIKVGAKAMNNAQMGYRTADEDSRDLLL
jgi:hypothetical protein